MNKRIIFTVLSPHIGAHVENLDLSYSLSDSQFAQLHDGLLQYQVLFFRDQIITPIQQRELAMRFGSLHIHPVYPHAEGVEEIIVLDTHQDNPPDNDNWHTDVTFINTPPAIAILVSKLLPESGGDTLWTNCISAYEALSNPVKNLLNALLAEHDFKKSFPEFKYCVNKKTYDHWHKAVIQHPPVKHPVIRTHPLNGRKSLFVNEGFTTRLIGLNEKESKVILEYLFSHINKPEFQVRWKWKENDIAIWDNRTTQHYANADYYPSRRIMHRATVLGDVPFNI